jgi:putative FmdB family regulatory protein
MPLYVYRCPECAHETELAHSFHEEPVIVCNKCSTQMKRRPQPFRWGFSAFDILHAESMNQLNKRKGKRRSERDKLSSPIG